MLLRKVLIFQYSLILLFKLLHKLKIFISTAISGSFDDLMPPPEKYIFNFNSKQELTKWHLYSDSEFGGTLFFVAEV